MRAKMPKLLKAATILCVACMVDAGDVEAQRGNPGSRQGPGSGSGGGSSRPEPRSAPAPAPRTPSGGDRPGGDRTGGERGGSTSRVEVRRDPGSRTGGTVRTEDPFRPGGRDPYSRPGTGDIYSRDREGRVPTASPYERPRGSYGGSAERSGVLRRDRARDIFTRSVEGRRYDNGIVLRPGTTIIRGGVGSYFPGGVSFFGGWYNTPVAGTYWSPYGFYSGMPVWVQPSTVIYAPPAAVYIENRVYDDPYDRSRRALDDYYLNRRDGDNRPRRQRPEDRYTAELDRAVEDLREAFRTNNIQPLVKLTDPAVRISVVKEGKYQYTLSADEYLDITRDMLRTTDTIDFEVYDVERKADTVAVVTIRHTYTTGDNRDRTVYTCFALERLLGRWTLTQVGTAPARR